VKVSSTELPPRQVSLAIEVEPERLDRAMDDAFRRLAGRVDVPGFRRGKAPRSMVERMVGRDRIVEEALDVLLPQVVSEAMEQEKVEPFTRPRVESIEFDPLRLKAVVGLAPKVELGDYKDQLHVDNEEPNVDDAQVDSVIQRLRESYAQWAPVERAAQTGDRVGVDVHAEVEGQERPLVDSKEAEYVVDSAGAQPAPGFADQIVGMSPAEQKSFTLTMPDDARDTEVAGKPAEFTVTLHWVKERELPELDDDFAQQVGEYTDVAGLRTAIETQLRQREEERVREQLEESAMNKLVEISSIEYPPQLVDHQAEHLIETFTNGVERQGIQLQQYLRMLGKEREAFEQELHEQAEAQVKRSLALDAFADAEEIQADQDDPEYGRQRKAIARLVQLAVSDSVNGTTDGSADEKEVAEMAPAAAETSDTGTQSAEAEAEAEGEAKSPAAAEEV
jgi:trigger factor